MRWAAAALEKGRWGGVGLGCSEDEGGFEGKQPEGTLEV